MSNPFAYVPNAAPQAEAVPGSSFEPMPTDIYKATLKALYLEPTKKGGLSMTVHAVINGNEESFTVYPINVAKDGAGNLMKDGNGVPVQTNHYLDKNGKVVYYADFVLMDGLVQVATGKSLAELQTSELIVDVYDFTARAKVKKTVAGYKDVQGKEINLAIQRQIENKSKKDERTGAYVPIAETRTKNVLIKAFDQNMLTNQEKQAGVTQPTYAPEWLKKFKGVDLDRTDKSLKAGLPQAQGQAFNAPAAGSQGNVFEVAAGAALSTEFS